ncbi:MTG1 Peripheral GTPase of the mitochondrial inner membrane essential for respiratory competence [Fusarium beomiforme]|uniref:MTG1 Peripheral GTPase of the mitochondrial inner membrane essential for respiratory competence n=1 Tax=Fusarium beomiforme TaxID=44412 RepID=A0A9P5E087_9HYPO|nr:MTG1 Peripheral GTPase of the mitochondrial inner membrane essential for respiratory competence [Fusarium beomiforme]
MAQFVPRKTFAIPNSIPKTYYLGHHAKGFDQMTKMKNRISLALECRDARIPLTSHNPNLDRVIGGCQRIIVYTKCDYTTDTPQVQNALRKLYGDSVFFWDKNRSSTTDKLLKKIKAMTKAHDSLVGLWALVVGVPNVGKSSLLNALRFKGIPRKTAKAAKTGGQAGITRKLGNSVRIFDPDSKKGGVGKNGAFLVDTPGVFQPYVHDGEAMLKIALVQGIKDGLIQEEILVDYLLHRMNLFNPTLYKRYCDPTNDVHELLDAVARQEGLLKVGSVPHLQLAAKRVLHLWRHGKLGRFVLDDMSEKGLKEHQDSIINSPLSLNQARKQRKQAIAQERSGA